MKIRNMKQVKQVTAHMKDVKMKRLFRRNQIIITTLAVMIAAAGYLNYAGKRDLAAAGNIYEAGMMDISDEDLLAENKAAGDDLLEIGSLDQDSDQVEEALPSEGQKRQSSWPRPERTWKRRQSSWLWQRKADRMLFQKPEMHRMLPQGLKIPERQCLPAA